jgi:predicted RNase H-like nuclease
VSHARYFVMGTGERWLVTFEGAAMARFATRTEAIEAAIVMADLMGAMQHDADVMVEMAHGLPLELIWTYGRSRAPKVRKPASPAPEAPPARVRHVQHGAAA